MVLHPINIHCKPHNSAPQSGGGCRPAHWDNTGIPTSGTEGNKELSPSYLEHFQTSWKTWRNAVMTDCRWYVFGHCALCSAGTNYFCWFVIINKVLARNTLVTTTSVSHCATLCQNIPQSTTSWGLSVLSLLYIAQWYAQCFVSICLFVCHSHFSQKHKNSPIMTTFYRNSEVIKDKSEKNILFSITNFFDLVTSCFTKYCEII